MNSRPQRDMGAATSREATAGSALSAVELRHRSDSASLTSQARESPART